MNLVGKKYPIRDENDVIVGYKTIKKFNHLSNAAAVVLSLKEDQEPDLLIGYAEAARIDNNSLDIPEKSFD